MVALGGGHGLHVTLSALRRVVTDLTGIVTVADNGGSSGRLREEFGVLPPGDLRMALAALCGDDEWGQTWAKVLQYRFTGDGELGGHVVGNVLITALWELLGEHAAGLDWVGRLLDAEGRVLPMADEPLDIEAQVRGHDPAAPDTLTTVRGQKEIALSPGSVTTIRLTPPTATASPEALAAIAAADWIFLGPGSWYTSVIPHLLLPDLRQALEEARARKVVVLNLLGEDGETTGYTNVDLLAALFERAPELRLDLVLADRAAVQRRGAEADELAAAVASAGGTLVLADIAADDGEAHHDPQKLADACAQIIGNV
ncbi:gluconeogenesis factor YvcK family protein [Nocardioides sp. Bht2]|uniref:gluconeogenesis factor YvcK family protein n=1 Tax=Nocardioides sp. Bht2 TaxID=3392297 RepID=UPI0039B5257A